MTESTVTARQFISFETIAAMVFSLFVAVCAWTWTSRVAVVDGRFEKVEAKQDQMIVTLAKIESKMATKDDMIQISSRISNNEKSIGILNVKVEHLQNQ